MENWAMLRSRNPAGLVMDAPEWRRAYAPSPNSGYESPARPLMYRGEDPPLDFNPLACVLRVENRGRIFLRLREAGVVRKAGVVLSWTPVCLGA